MRDFEMVGCRGFNGKSKLEGSPAISGSSDSDEDVGEGTVGWKLVEFASTENDLELMGAKELSAGGLGGASVFGLFGVGCTTFVGEPADGESPVWRRPPSKPPNGSSFAWDEGVGCTTTSGEFAETLPWDEGSKRSPSKPPPRPSSTERDEIGGCDVLAEYAETSVELDVGGAAISGEASEVDSSATDE